MNEWEKQWWPILKTVIKSKTIWEAMIELFDKSQYTTTFCVNDVTGQLSCIQCEESIWELMKFITI